MILSVLAALVGIVVAFATMGFRHLIGLVQLFGYGFADENVTTGAANLPTWQLLAVPTIGGLVIGLLVHYGLPGRRPQGVPETIESAALNQGRMPLRSGLVAALTSASAIGFGASVGREGPVVHLGGTLAAWFSNRLNLSPTAGRTILGCGAAAAVAASFNAPIAGVFFALEVVIGHYALPAFAPIVIASVVGTIVTRIYIGEFPAFIVPEYTLATFAELPAFFLLGALCAITAVAFMRAIALFDKLRVKLPVPPWCTPAIAGLVLGGVAIFYPHILGVGYEATDNALKGAYGLQLLLSLLVLKLAVTALCLGLRFGSGVFSAAIYLGAMAGGAFGTILAIGFPESASHSGPYAIAGMSAVAASVLGAPISTILMVFELTANYHVLVAVMVATSTASVITQQLYGKSFFHWQLAQRGLDLSRGRAHHFLHQTDISALVRTDCHFLSESTPVAKLRELWSETVHDRYLVVNDEHRLVGTIGRSEIRAAFNPEETNTELTARDFALMSPVVLRPDDRLETALEVLENSGEDSVAVIADYQSMKAVGTVSHRDLLLAYNKALLAEQAEEHGNIHEPATRPGNPGNKDSAK